MVDILRRNIITTSMAGAAALLSTSNTSKAYATQTPKASKISAQTSVQFIGDGINRSPAEYARLLSELTEGKDGIRDSYGQGGAVQALEEKFAAITNKEKAIFMPTGTMANQLAVKALSGSRSKVMVQDISHYYRDEADSAQVVHGRRLVPVKENSGRFTLSDVKAAIDTYRSKEYFNTDVGAISIENPVRRAYEQVFDISEIKKISAFARQNKIGMHLDGARLYMASAYTGISIEEYSQYFDTVYISLYKYLGAGSGAILCGPAAVINTMPNLIKVYGGNTAQSWSDAVVALHTLCGFEKRFAGAKAKATALFTQLNKIDGLAISAFEHGSNVFKLSLQGINPDTFRTALQAHRVYLRGYNEDDGFISLKVNETILSADNSLLVSAFADASLQARV